VQKEEHPEHMWELNIDKKKEKKSRMMRGQVLPSLELHRGGVDGGVQSLVCGIGGQSIPEDNLPGKRAVGVRAMVVVAGWFL
jgi:hypothetical protein